MTPREVFDKIVPPFDIPRTRIRDARGVRRIAQKDLGGALRLPRGDGYKSELVAAYRHYDGYTGGEAGYYANIYNAWRHGTQTWRSGGVRILPFEAARIARAIKRGTGTKPGDEPDRIGGTGAVTQLRAVVFGEAVLLFVRFGGRGGVFFRSRGVLICPDDREAIADGLQEFAKRR